MTVILEPMHSVKEVAPYALSIEIFVISYVIGPLHNIKNQEWHACNPHVWMIWVPHAVIVKYPLCFPVSYIAQQCESTTV